MPPVVLEIIVNADKGIVQLKSFDKAVQDTSKSVQKGGQAQGEAAKSSSALGSSLASTAKSAAGLALGFSGVGAIAGAIASVTTSVVDFEREMANVNTLLGKGSAGQFTALREQLLALPPALGDATTLAKGLYSALSAGVEAGQAVGFVATAAKAAKAGMAELSVAADALATVLQGYKLDASEATRVSDLMFQTVNVGKGTFQEFSRAFATVAPIASTMGINLEELSATLGTLSFAFPSAAEGAQGLRSVLSNLIQNGEKFAAIGINVQKVISEEGLTGLFKRLNEATRGNLAAVQELIPDVQGLQAVLATVGPLAEKQAKNLEVMANAAGSTGEAFKKTQDTMSASLANLGNQITTVASTAAPGLLSIAKAVTNSLGGALQVGIAGTTAAFNDMSFAALKAGEAIGLNGPVARVTADESRRLTDEVIRQKVSYDAVAEATAAATAAAKQQAEALTAAYTGLGIKSSEQLQLLATTAISNFQKVLDAGKEPPARLAVLYEDLVKQTREAFGTLPPAVDAIGVAIRKLRDQEVVPFAAQIDKAFQELGLKSSQALIASAEKGTQALQKLVSTGQLSAQQLAPAFDAVAKRWEGLSTTIPAAVEQVAVAIGQRFQAMAASGQEPPSLIQAQWQKTRDTIITLYGELPPALTEIDAQIMAQADTTARGITAAYKNFGIQTSAELQKLAMTALAEFDAIRAKGETAPRDLLKAWLDVVGKIDQGAFKTLPEGFQASAAAMTEIARKLGVDLPKPVVDAFGQITMASQQAAAAIDLSWLQTQGALERANAATKELTYSTQGLSESAIMLGHTITSLGEEVNAYGNAVAKTTDQTQALLNLQISSTERFATDVKGLLEQVAQTRKEYFNILGSGFATTSEKDYYLGVLGKKLKMLQDLLAGLGYDELGRPLATPGGTPTRPGGTTTTTSIPVIRRQHGGPVSAGQPYLVGERGPEVVMPRQSGTVLPAGQTGGHAITYNLVIHTQATDAATLARDLVPYLRQADLTSRRFGG